MFLDCGRRGVAEHRFPAGTLTVVEGAHDLVGSNPHLFGRIVACALSLMLDDRERDPKNIAAFLNEAIF
ncbi:MAG: hypothetical protein ACTHU0_08755 [Kofleriaceae bacterium]